MTVTARRWHRRELTAVLDGVHTVEHTARRAVELTSVAAVWQSGNPGPVTLTIDGHPVAAPLDGGSAGIAVFRFDRAELLAEGQTIAVTMPTAGHADIQGDQPC